MNIDTIMDLIISPIGASIGVMTLKLFLINKKTNQELNTLKQELDQLTKEVDDLIFKNKKISHNLNK